MMHYFRHPLERLSILGPGLALLLWLAGARFAGAVVIFGVGAGALGIFWDELTSYAGRRQRISALWHIPWYAVRKGLWVFLVTHLPIFIAGLVMVLLS